MNSPRFLVAALWAVAISCAWPQDAGPGTPVAGIMKYREALLAANGRDAWKCVDKRTRDYYDKVLQESVSAPKGQVEKMNFLTRLMLLRCRVELSKAELEKMTGEDLFVMGVEKQWISRTSVENMKEMVVLTNDGSKALLAFAQRPAVPTFIMQKEESEWKVDLTAVFETANKAMKQMAAQAGKTENEMIFELLRLVSKKTFDDSVWNGPMQ